MSGLQQILFLHFFNISKLCRLGYKIEVESWMWFYWFRTWAWQGQVFNNFSLKKFQQFKNILVVVWNRTMNVIDWFIDRSLFLFLSQFACPFVALKRGPLILFILCKDTCIFIFNFQVKSPIQNIIKVSNKLLWMRWD